MPYDLQPAYSTDSQAAAAGRVLWIKATGGDVSIPDATHAGWILAGYMLANGIGLEQPPSVPSDTLEAACAHVASRLPANVDPHKLGDGEFLKTFLPIIAPIVVAILKGILVPGA